MATQTRTQRSASAKKAAATRKRNTSRSTARRTSTQARSTARGATTTARQRTQAELRGAEGVVQQAQRVVLIPVGAALVARDNVAETVKPFRTRASAEREISRLGRRVNVNLNKFERRGNTARNQLERRVKRTRTQIERLVRRNQRTVERQVKSARRDFSRGAGDLQKGAQEFVSSVSTVA
jgi:hypothetical protein